MVTRVSENPCPLIVFIVISLHFCDMVPTAVLGDMLEVTSGGRTKKAVESA